MIYSSIENKKIKDLKKLSQKKYRDEQSCFLVEGTHLVLEAYKKGLLKELIIEENEQFSLDVEVTYVTKSIINYLSDLETPQNILGVCFKKQENKAYLNKLLILDDIQDPGNLGTIIRSAVAFNIDTIILGEKCVDLYNSKVIRGSQGMLFHINIVRENLEKVIPVLKTEDFKIIGTKVTFGKSLKSLEKFEKFAIIMGNEGSGIRKEISELCDDFIFIAMNDICESLNVAVATSIILYELDK